MIEWLDTHVLYWHWIVIGLLLITIELLVPVFVMLWLGVAATLVGLVLLVISFGFAGQLLLWVILSTLLLLLWHKYISPRMHDRTLAGLSREAIIGQVGMVVSFNPQLGRGMLKFPAPIIGNDEWTFIHTEPLANGDKVQVMDISGNSLLIKPFS